MNREKRYTLAAKSVLKLLKIRPRNRVQWSCLAVLGKQVALSTGSLKVSERSGHPVGHVVFVEKSQFFLMTLLANAEGS